MIKTLHWYLTRDLARVTTLALIAFTLVMTIFAVIEPMRKQGLSSQQVVELFGYTLPVMLSLTLPVAALFATTIVYGRFSQENELLACRASGISTLSLLKPALILGLLVTVTSALLSNFVTPKLAALGSKAVKSNVRGIIYHKLQTQSYFRFGSYVVHAQYADPDQDTITGLVAVDARRADDVQLFAASKAFAYFDTDDQDETFATFHLINPALFRTSTKQIVQLTSTPLESVPLPSLLREDASWYDWNRLVATLQQPVLNGEIRRELSSIRRRYCHDMLITRVADTINAGKPYTELQAPDERYEITAARAEAGSDGVARLFSAEPPAPGPRRVEVKVIRDGRIVEIVTAGRGRVTPSWSARSITGLTGVNPQGGQSLVTIEMLDQVSVRRPEEKEDLVHRREDWTTGKPKIPDSILASTLHIPLEQFYEHPEDFHTDKWVGKQLATLHDSLLPMIVRSIIAELHSRISYSLSCFLLVSLGAALGLIFRGGQIVSAFALSVIPAALVIILMLMGREMVRNPGVNMLSGLVAIWAGIVLLALADLVIYVRLMRK